MKEQFEKTIKDTIQYLEDQIIECNPYDGCGRCNEGRRLVVKLKELLKPVPQPTDEEIRQWAEDQWTVQRLFNYKGDGADLISMGAKAMRDGNIPAKGE